MVEWFTWAQIVVALIVGLGSVLLGLLGRKPDDFTLGAALLVEVLLLAQLIVAIIAPTVGNEPTGNLLEFYVYLVSAIVMVPLAGFWALIERTRWSTVVLGVAGLAIAVMVYRMHQIWAVQVA